jgi:enamine deaminase RidA (YjgF/YER057c/UK114 family)
VTPEQATELAATCALNAIAAVRSVVDLERVVRVVKVVGFVASVPGFTGQPGVVNGASNLLKAAFGEAGVHARSAVGVAALPLDAPVELEMIVELAD